MEQSKNYQLENEEVIVKIASIGAELKSFQTKNKIEYIWNANPKYWNFSAPFLFPIVGTLRDKKTVIDNKEYFIKQHGLLRHQKFLVVKHTSDYILLKNEYSDETLSVYPFKYQAFVEYKLKTKTLTTKITIVNVDHRSIVFNLGGHPGFNCPIYQGESFSDYTLFFSEPETFSSPKVTKEATLNFSEPVLNFSNLTVLPLEKKMFEIDTIIIPRVKSKSVSLLNREKKGLKFSFDNFKTLAIWTPTNEAPFICLEPWIGYNDHHDSDYNFYNKDDLIRLAVNEEISVAYQMEIID
ncbi:MAG: aldose 1-epimerase family protein [Bacilli bacterium]|nr:aldose 1-epimerase family protein [Bacilli bacterium]